VDPNFSVLLGDKPTTCDAKDTTKIIAIVVPVVVVVIVALGVSLLFSHISSLSSSPYYYRLSYYYYPKLNQVGKCTEPIGGLKRENN
jgi:hypothetical protein